jgi:hypothetical protein
VRHLQHLPFFFPLYSFSFEPENLWKNGSALRLRVEDHSDATLLNGSKAIASGQ